MGIKRLVATECGVETITVRVAPGEAPDPDDLARLERAGWTLVRTVQRGWLGPGGGHDLYYQRPRTTVRRLARKRDV
jgi:hypothetical protein